MNPTAELKLRKKLLELCPAIEKDFRIYDATEKERAFLADMAYQLHCSISEGRAAFDFHFPFKSIPADTQQFCADFAIALLKRAKLVAPVLAMKRQKNSPTRAERRQNKKSKGFSTP